MMLVYLTQSPTKSVWGAENKSYVNLLPLEKMFEKPLHQVLLLLTQAGPPSSWPRATHYCFSITEQSTAGRYLLFTHPSNQLKNSWSFAEPLKIRAILQGAVFAQLHHIILEG